MDLSCPICTELLCRPVTTPCGHSFCKLCLELALSTKPYCPICREPCPFPHLMKVAIALNAVIESNFSALNAARVVDLTQAVARIRRLVIGNTYEAMPRGAAGQHKWKLYVRMLNVPVDFSRGSQVNASEFVEKIEVHLHSTFVPSMVELTSEPFEVERIGWSTFGIRVKIFFRPQFQKGPMEIIHGLSFASPDTSSMYSIQFQSANR